MEGIKRDDYDDQTKEIRTGFFQRHKQQLDNAKKAENVDRDWIEDKNRVIQLNQKIHQRRKNFDTYKNSIEVEKILYNRERHYTILLGIANALAIGGCAYVWMK
uniref:Uncharacterized protein n=1 Tax=viral metagenome TaxID=1070528 RepID=A0A6C0L0C5_9ZZZZ|tara:strand:+ start:8420 stop:8731 length:312 start_codon:yes stop_codon:yes gene_type:complete